VIAISRHGDGSVRAVRIVVVSAWEPWRTTDGAAFVLDHQLRILGSRHDVTLLAAGAPSVTTEPPGSVAETLPGIDVRWFGTDTGPTVDYLLRRATSLRRREPSHVGFVERPALVAALQDVVAAGVDVLHLHGWGTAGLGRHAAGAPTLHMAIDPWSVNAGNRRLSLARRIAEPEQGVLIRDHERRHYPDLGAVVVVTERDAAALRTAAPGARIEVVPNGVVPGPEPPPLASRPVLGFHGVFDSQANVDAARNLVEQVLPRVRRTVPATQVMLVGRRPPRAVRSLAGQGVHLIADAPDLQRELSKMTVHVDWMTSGTGIKNKVLEAMAAARPVVTSPAGAEGIGEGPGLLVAESIEQAAEMTVGLLRNPPAAAETGRAGRARVVADFSWEANAARIEALWSELAG
jgi:glycosyltransferase involved in cell wall biosynthesis